MLGLFADFHLFVVFLLKSVHKTVTTCSNNCMKLPFFTLRNLKWEKTEFLAQCSEAGFLPNKKNSLL